MFLIHPPVSKPSEPPAGLARLAGALGARDYPFVVLDANLEGLLYLLKKSTPADDTWTRRALRNVDRNQDTLRDWRTYRNPDRYSRAVRDLGRVLEKAGDYDGFHIGLANYQDDRLSPLNTEDLMASFQVPDKNPFYPYFSERLSALIAEKKPLWIGFSINFLSQALCTFAMIGFIKQTFPETKIILGGGLVTSWMHRPGWDNPFKGLVDEMVRGPGEEPLLHLLGIEQPATNFIPDYAGFPLRNYFSPGLILPYSASSGCYWSQCTFCPERTEANPYMPIPAPTVIRDLKTLCAQYRPGLIHFTDNALSPSLLQTLILEPPGVPWYGFARCTDHLTDPNFCLGLKKSGCVLLKLGLESGDQAVLDRMHKGHTVETAELILRNLKKAGIATYVYLLFGTQHENLDQARRTKEFAVKHSAAIDFLNIAIFNMPFHSIETDTLETQPFYEGDLPLYTDFTHPQGWGRRDVRTFLNREFKKEPTLARIVKNDPPVFTSNHAALFVMERKGNGLQGFRL
ncbi:MAG: radical SAM protein [Desulfobacteraceae bacterium]|nr:MAG: radical SAM protein [Desulfobacteraceae bacterium]